MTFVSERRGMVLLRPHKTAGKSLSVALSEATGEPPKRYRGHALQAHELPKHLFERFPELNNFHVVGVLRDPWDRLVSYYYWARDSEPIRSLKDEIRISHLRSYRRFGDYVRDLHETFLTPGRFNPWSMAHDPAVGAVNYQAQHTWLCIGEELAVDHLGRFEALGVVVSHLEEVIGGRLHLPHVHQTVRPATAEAYDAETASMVGAIFRRDIELGGYEPPA